MKSDTAQMGNAANAVFHNGKGTEFSSHGQVELNAPWDDTIPIKDYDPNNLDDVFAAMREEMLSGQEYPLQPITPPEAHQSDPEKDNGAQHHVSCEMPSRAAQEAEITTPPTDECMFDFSLVDNPEPNPNVGLFAIKAANQWIEEASSRPMPCKLFGQLWFEHEICILFSDSNLGKSILAVQIADAISRGRSAMGMAMEAAPQKVIYCDFELSDKQFELRYVGDDGTHYQFSPNLLRAEIDPDVAEYPDGCDFEEYVKMSLEQAVEESGVKVIVLDNITYLSRETEKAKNAQPLMMWLKDFGKKNKLSILVLAHTPKRSMANPITKNDLQGSKMLYNFCDGCFAIGESTKGGSLRYIKELKQRNLPFAFEADNVIVCEIVKPDNFLMFRFVGYGCESEHLRRINDTDRDAMIERANELSAKGKSQREIASDLGISVGAVNKYLKMQTT